MASKKHGPAEGGGGGHGGEHLPSWIMSFGDMITNMMAFFVMIQSFSHVQDAGLYSAGRGSFRQAIAGMGLPAWLYGQDEKGSAGYHKVKHPTEEAPSEETPNRVIDADGERIRKAFSDLRGEMEATAANVAQEPLRVEATSIRFPRARANLNSDARACLQQIAFDLEQSIRAPSVRVYVIGLATDVSDPVQQWALSAQRAAAAESCLTGILAAHPAVRGWAVHSWGAGAGDEWCRKQGFAAGGTSIVLVVVKETPDNG